jgi:N-ethylmaleimide reductase
MPTPLFNTFKLGDLELKNRIVMSSLSRCRANNPGNVPNDMMVDYYSLRTDAGLILSEGSWISPESIGFFNVPAIYTEEQIEGWRKITDAVHAKGGKIFFQMGHLGAVSHPDHLEGKTPVGPSSINPLEMAFTHDGFQQTITPREMTVADIRQTVTDYANASANALRAGFDGVEIHGAYLYLIPEFLNSATNQRTDSYGGSPENRARFLLEIVAACIAECGPKKVAVKISPGVISGLVSANEDSAATYQYLVERLNDFELAFLHGWGFPNQPEGTAAAQFNDIARYLRKHYHGTLVVSGGYTKESAEALIADRIVDLVAFGTPFVANPDLVERLRNNYPLSMPRADYFYQGGHEGYMDYPAYAVEVEEAAV